MRPDKYSFWIRKQRYSFSKYAPNKIKKKIFLRHFVTFLSPKRKSSAWRKESIELLNAPMWAAFPMPFRAEGVSNGALSARFNSSIAPFSAFSLHCCACNEGLLSVVSLVVPWSLVTFCNDFYITISHEVQEKWASQREKSRQKQMAI